MYGPVTFMRTCSRTLAGYLLCGHFLFKNIDIEKADKFNMINHTYEVY